MSESVIPAAVEPTPEAASTVAPEAPAAIPATTAHADAIDVLLAQWAVEFLHDSPVSRATEAMNHFTTIALPALRQRLLSEV